MRPYWSKVPGYRKWLYHVDYKHVATLSLINEPRIWVSKHGVFQECVYWGQDAKTVREWKMLTEKALAQLVSQP